MTRVTESLAQIRPPWMIKISQELAQVEGVRESFLPQLNRFYDLLEQAIENGNSERLNPLLDEWVEAHTETELEKRENSLAPILGRMLQFTHELSCEILPEEDALNVLSALLPIYTHAFEYSTRRFTDLQIEHVSRGLERIQSTLERLDKSKSDFIAIAAHELKTPLTLIEGYAAMLKEYLTEEDHQDQTSVLLDGIYAGTRRLREIVNDMIDVSKIDNNLLSLRFQPLWLNKLLKFVSDEFAQPVKERGQVLAIHPFPGSDEMTFGDEERLYQALRNVISNAIKYTPDGGSISVDGRRLPGFIEVTVTDSGIGIKPEDQVNIFEKFGRLGSASLHSSGKTKFKGGGPGLGLPITKGIIEAHGGAIWVESGGYDEVKFPGTSFHILLPIRKEPPDDKSAKLFRPIMESSKDETVYPGLAVKPGQDRM